MDRRLTWSPPGLWQGLGHRLVVTIVPSLFFGPILSPTLFSVYCPTWLVGTMAAPKFI